MKLQLILPKPEHAQQIMAYKADFLANGDSMDGTSNLSGHDTFDSWYTANCKLHSIETCPKELVTSHTYLAFDETEKLVGFIDFRHELNEYLAKFGGHIGYSVLPSERKKGYATQMLELCLEKCKERSLEKVLVTCDDKNIASAKTIEKNGGILENKLPEGEKLTRRYWITL